MTASPSRWRSNTRARWSRAGSTWSPWESGPTSGASSSTPGATRRRVSEVLHARGLDATGKPRRVDLPPRQGVTPENVEDAFDQVAAEVEDHPQDKVVVFLAGHTGVFDANRFCLLLPTYPFPADAPEVALARDVAPEL